MQPMALTLRRALQGCVYVHKTRAHRKMLKFTLLYICPLFPPLNFWLKSFLRFLKNYLGRKQIPCPEIPFVLCVCLVPLESLWCLIPSLSSYVNSGHIRLYLNIKIVGRFEQCPAWVPNTCLITIMSTGTQGHGRNLDLQDQYSET